jgi:hypothetical protein
MKKQPKDRHLDIPSEANRDKHINFTAMENDEQDPADIPDTGVLTEQEGKQKQDEKRNKGDKVYKQ